MSDSLPQPAQPKNRPFLDIPREIQIPGTKVKVPTWLPIAAGVLIVVLLVLWRRNSGAEVYEPEGNDQGSADDEIAADDGPFDDGVAGGDIEDIPAGLPPVVDVPPPDVPPLALEGDQPLPPEWESAPVFTGSISAYDWIPDTEPGAAAPAARQELVSQATSTNKPLPPLSRGQPTATTKQPKPSVSGAVASVSQKKVVQTPLGRVTSGVTKRATQQQVQSKPDKPKPAPRPLQTVAARWISGVSKLFGGRR